MTTVTTSIRIDADLKKKAAALAKEMGLSLSQITERYWKQFVVERKITFQPIYDDTDPRYYETDDAIPVNEPMEVVLEYLEQLYPEKKKDVETTAKILE